MKVKQLISAQFQKYKTKLKSNKSNIKIERRVYKSYFKIQSVIPKRYSIWFFAKLLAFLSISYGTGTSGCNKVIEINPPNNSITTTETFSDEEIANSALAGIYSSMINTNNVPGFASGALTIYCGLSSDELISFFQTDENEVQFYNNNLISNNSIVLNNIWSQAYSIVYKANACLEGLAQSTKISEEKKKRFIGEAKFLRAFCNFYLTNLFGEIPIVKSTDWKASSTIERISEDQVYASIIDDLLDAQNKLSEDYASSQGERARPNKWTALAFLAKVYLYNSDWDNAFDMSNAVISNNSLFSLESDINRIFLIESTETIWQLKPDNSIQFPYVNIEASLIIPPSENPNYYFSDQFINSFEPSDQRRSKWIDSLNYLGTEYYYPYKYKDRGIGLPNQQLSEYYLILRLAEQYLIRAEASAHLNNRESAISDLNAIRVRSGLAPLSSSLNQAEVLTAIERERNVELFSEWGNRWFDLKRTNRVSAVLTNIKGGNWQSTDQLYPIPLAEIQLNPRLKQNSGY